ncbi:GlcG/HbpS family heme-binding protein [Pseudomonas putida]
MTQWLRQQPTITLALAMECLQAALKQAQELNVAVSLVILDGTGVALHTAHMDGAPRPAQAIALNKALTAAGFGSSTGSWSERLERCSSAVQIGLPLQPAMALFGGGEPFLLEGQIIGAIGVSGASEDVDGVCASAAVKRLSELVGQCDKA